MPRTPAPRTPSPRTSIPRALPLTRTLPLRAVAGTRRPLPATVVPSAPALLDAAVDWALYQDGVRQPTPDFETAVERAKDGDGFLWLGLHEPAGAQLTQLGETVKKGVREVRLTVSWDEGKTERSFTVVTHMVVLQPKEAT